MNLRSIVYSVLALIAISPLFLITPIQQPSTDPLLEEISVHVNTIEIPQIKVIEVDVDQMHCLAKNIYFEARGETTIGKIAVANVTVNRVNDQRFPNTICGVVHQAVYSTWWKENHDRLVPVRNMCQFTWYCDGKSDTLFLTDTHGNVIKANMEAWKESLELAELALKGELTDVTNGATHYFNPRLADPYWQHAFVQTAQIDNHTFFIH